MKIITINVSEVYLDFFEKLIKLRIVPSRSEAIRHLIELGFDVWCKQLAFIGKILMIDEENKTNKDKVIIPEENYKKFTTYNILRKLDENPNHKGSINRK